MRVYQAYHAAIHKSLVPFSNLFDFTDAFLRKNGWQYKEIQFAFELHVDEAEAFLEKYPYWRAYSTPPAAHRSFKKFSNVPEQPRHLARRMYWNPPIQNREPVDVAELKKLLAKIPRPLNFPGFVVYFDGIDWLQTGGHGRIGFGRDTWPNGAIFDVTAAVDVTSPKGPCEVLDASKITPALNEHFFDLFGTASGYSIGLDDDEAKQFESFKLKIEPAITAFRENAKAEPPVAQYSNFYQFSAACTKASKTRFTVVKPLKSTFKDWDYTPHSTSIFSMTKIINHGFQIEVLVYFKPGGSSELSREITISGLCFNFRLSFDQILRSSQEAINAFIVDCKLIADEAEQLFSEPLFQLYGETPEWYFK